MEMEKLINTLNELSAELATQPETWKQMAIIKAISTIQALQQEYDELDTGHSKLFKTYCEMKQEAEQLQAQNGVMREALRHGVNLADGLYGTGEFVCWAHDDAEPALSSEAGRNYHNPADVEALKQAESRLKVIEQATEYIKPNTGVWHTVGIALDEIHEALAAIDKVVGE